MKTSLIWIPVVAAAAPIFLYGEGLLPGGQSPLNELPVVATAEPSLEEAPESVVLEHILKKHHESLSEVERSALSAAASRFENDHKEALEGRNADLGVTVVPLDEATRRLIQPEIEGGLMVTEATKEGVLSYWGVGQYDLIVATNGQAVHNARALQDVLENAVETGDAVILDVIVQGNRRLINLLPLRDKDQLKLGLPRFWQMRGC